MKLTVLFITLALLQVSAKSFSQITLNLKNVPVQTVIESIESQSDYVFLYNEDQLNTEKISVKVSDASIKETLDKCFKGLNISYRIVKNNVTLVKKPEVYLQYFKVIEDAFLADTLINVTGKVVDTTGVPIPGVNVTVVPNGKKGVLYATTTTATGEFIFSSVPKNSIISFSMVGYTTQAFSLMQQWKFNVALKVNTTSLKEVTVNTGIYTRKANSFTGSTMTITSEQIKKVGNANFFQALKNISPSMVLDNFAQGSNPNALPDIQLRGTSTFPLNQDDLSSSLKSNYQKSPNEPLFILDGFEATLERIFDLDINRIETVTILKDAASKALYGSKAANGVIVIETKKLTASKPRITYNASVDVDLPDLSSYNLANSLQKLEAERIDGYYNGGLNDPQGAIEGQQLYNLRRKAALEGLDTYWMAKPLQNGVGQKHTLAAELGGSNLNVFADVSYRDVVGVMKGSNRKNISGNMSTSYRVKNLLFRNITSITANNETKSPFGTFGEYARMNPYWRAENPDGSIPYYAEENDVFSVPNPLYNSTLQSKNLESYLNFTNNFYLEWTIMTGLRATTRLGVDLQNSDADEFYPAGHTMFESYIGDELSLRKGLYQVNNGKSKYLSGDFNINYSKEIGKHVIFANGGFNISERTAKELVHTAEGFPSETMDNILFARGYALDSRPTGINAIRRELGFLGTFSYMFDNRFLTDFTYRTNASSQFGANKRWSDFWSIGLGWNVHNESFFDGFTALKLFKIRGSVGSTGNSNFLTNASIATYNYYQSAFYQGFPGSYLVSLANPDLQWESKFDYNAGADITIGRVNLRIDYYQGYTKNLLTDVTVPASTGFNLVKENIGEVKNTGFEVYGNYNILQQGRNFLSFNFGLETNKNKIIELSNSMKAYNQRMEAVAASRSQSKPVLRYVDGMSMNAIWAVPSLGIDPATGREIYVKQNGETTFNWDPTDMVVAGNSNPDYQGILGLSGEYKGIGASVTARYLGGGQMYNQTLVDRVENVDMNYNVDLRVLTGRWNTPGQNALFKRLAQYQEPGSPIAQQEVTRATTRFVQDRNDFTIAAVNIYYLFNDNFVKRLKLQRLKLGFNMNEVATFSSIRIERGTAYPYARTLSFNLSATF